MKKKITAITILLCLTLICAQSMKAQVKFGVKGGVTLSQLSLDHDDLITLNSRAGFFIGPTARLALPLGGLGIEAAALYEQRNVAHETHGIMDIPLFTTTIKQQQISIPLHLRYDIELNERMGLYGYAGPQIGFNVGKNIGLDYGEWSPANVNYSVNIGIGASYRHFQVFAGYSIGCGKTGEIFLIRPDLLIGKGRISAWQIGIGYEL